MKFNTIIDCRVDIDVPVFGRVTLLPETDVTFDEDTQVSPEYTIGGLTKSKITGSLQFKIHSTSSKGNPEMLILYKIDTPFTGEMNEPGLSIFPTKSIP